RTQHILGRTASTAAPAATSSTRTTAVATWSRAGRAATGAFPTGTTVSGQSSGTASGKVPRSVELALERPAEHALEPLRDRDQGVQVDPGLDSVAFEHVHEVLSGDVARSLGRERAAAETADRRVERGRASLEGRVGVREPRVPRVVPVEAGGAARLDERLDVLGGRHSDRV